MRRQKRFDHELYKKYDKKAKKEVGEIINKNKYKIEENSKKTGVDLLLYNRGNHVLNIEAEIKLVWKDTYFPWDTIQIPQRKAKFAILTTPTIYVIFNKKLTEYAVIKSKDLLNSPMKEVPNKYCWKGEYFYQVPLEKVTFNDINKVIEETI